MNLSVNQLAKVVLNKESLQDCSLQELQQLADQYPYFGPAQLLLLNKLKESDAAKYKEQLQKNSIFFQDPLWLEHLLNEPRKEEVAESKVEEKNKLEANDTKENVTTTEIPEVKPQTPEDSSSTLIFEPYHTVDYFASQGIKFRPEEKPKDKLGQQLKSFTEWLKTLKKLPQSEIAQPIESNIEQKVEQLAQHSIEDRQVVTEAMAEVWKKQGDTEKAIEIYQKLSLLDPSKSSYFAAKIEQLKKTS